MKFLIYALVDPRTLLVRYVGLSSSGMKRPRRHRFECYDDTYRARWLRGLRADELEPTIVVLETSDSRDALPDAERWWIAFGRACGWPLTNATDGGDGSYNPSPEVRAKLARATRNIHLGRKRTVETRRKMSIIAKRRGISNETNAKMIAQRKTDAARKLAASIARLRPIRAGVRALMVESSVRS